ncbi:MAG: SET domain-containing protein [Burkholderiaceae bacterium]|jgi:SET domain-containing protein
MNYRPLPPMLTIKDSNIEGLGLFALEPISENTNLGITHYKNIKFLNGYIRTPLGGFINHSDTPNCETVVAGKYLHLFTLSDIMPDEELTLKYNWYKV